MKHGILNYFRRITAALLCLSSLASCIVLPTYAAEDAATQPAPAAETSGAKVRLSVDTVNFFQAGKSVLVYGYTAEELANNPPFDGEYPVDGAASSFQTADWSDYTALVIEFIRTGSGNGGFDDTEYMIDDILDGSTALRRDTPMNQLHAKTPYGFVLYVPTATLNALPEQSRPARGDLVDSDFWHVNHRLGAKDLNSHLDLYDHSTVQISYAQATPVNATVKMFNYDETVNAIAESSSGQGKDFLFWSGFWGNGGDMETEDGEGAEAVADKSPMQHPIMADSLDEEGYPMLSDGSSLGYLFDDSYQTGPAMANGGGLFQVDEDGYYYYDSAKNAAYFNDDQFLLYDQLIVRPWYHSGAGSDSYYDEATGTWIHYGHGTTMEPYGNFLPFNEVTASSVTADGTLEALAVDPAVTNLLLPGTKGISSSMQQTLGTAKTTARLEQKADMWFGMTVEFEFSMPKAGTLSESDMVFQFRGDDDVWVYLGVWNEQTQAYDYTLTLDIGGVHEARDASINFATGVVTDHPCTAAATDSGTIYGDGYRTRTLQDIFNLEGITFPDHSKLSLKFFYIERGGNISYCRLRFNIPTLPTDSLTVVKELTGSAPEGASAANDFIADTYTYTFRVVQADENGIATNLSFFRDSSGNPTDATYEILENGIVTGTGRVKEDGSFTLKAGQQALFREISTLGAAEHYIVQEILPSDLTGQYQGIFYHLGGNGGIEVDGTGRQTPFTSFSTSPLTSGITHTVIYKNQVDFTNLGQLKITKAASEALANREFDIFITLGGKALPVGTQYYIHGETEPRSVTVAGVITLQPGQTATLADGVLAGTQYEIRELGAITGDFTASYSGTVSVDGVQTDTVYCTKSCASDTFPLKGQVHVTVTNQPADTSSAADRGLETDKYVQQQSDGSYLLTLEAYAQGTLEEITLTKPADIVLVLDHSASMHTPVGAPSVLYNTSVYSQTGHLSEDRLDTKLGQQFGYYVAQSVNTKSWFILQFDASTQLWNGYLVLNTEAIVNPEYRGIDETEDKGPSGWTEHHMRLTWGVGQIDDALVFYKSQYGMLYDAVSTLVKDLRDSGVEHRVAIVGFAGSQTEGSRLYVGGSEGIKAYKALYHENTTNERRTELYQLALKNVQDNDQYADLLNCVDSINTNYSFTCPSAGIRIATDLYAANEITLASRDRIMILFTDGIPNRQIGDPDGMQVDSVKQNAIFNEIIQYAYTAKSALDAQIYCTSTSTLGSDANRNFLNYASSDYPDATGYTTPGNPIFPEKYTSLIDETNDLALVFSKISQSATSTTVQLDETAVLREVLSDYFLLNGTEELSISTYTAAYNGETGLFDARQPFDGTVTLTASDGGTRLDTIEVTGFNYGEEYLSQLPREQNGVESYYGSKLILEVRIKTRNGFWGGNNVPTNEGATGIYAPEGLPVEKFPIPEVNVPVDVQVSAKDTLIYYTGDVTSDQLIAHIQAGGMDVTIDPETGKLLPQESWMDDFASLTWTETSTKPGTDLENRENSSHLFQVQLTPNSDGTGNLSPNPGTMAGTPVDTKGVTAEDTGNVYILVPQVTFRDSTTAFNTPAEGYDYAARDYVSTQWVPLDPEAQPADLTVSGTAPELALTYTPAAGIFVEDTKVNASVYLGEECIDSVTRFLWETCDQPLHDHILQAAIGEHMATADIHEFWIHVELAPMPDTVVIDFGLPVEIDVLSNDPRGEGVIPTLTGISSNRSDAAFGSCADGSFGSAVIPENSDLIRYTLRSMEMPGEDVFAYQVRYGTGESTKYFRSTVTVIPATSIYFEDSFVRFRGYTWDYDTNGWADNTQLWETAGETQSGIQDQDRPGEAELPEIDADNIYGKDSAYANMSTYSMGSARKLTADYDNYGEAEFRFQGTGFDVISLTGNTTGGVFMDVYRIAKDGTETCVRSNFLDTYYGYLQECHEVTYTYTSGEWVCSVGDKADASNLPETPATPPADPREGDSYTTYENVWVVDTENNSDNALYQIPILKVEGLEYGTYRVVLKVVHSQFFDHQQYDGSKYDFYLDAIRIYDPANDGKDNPLIEGIYGDDREGWPTYRELRNEVISAGTFDALGLEDSVSGIVYIDNAATDKAVPTVSDYISYGPNNELYLAPGQAIAFDLSVPGEVAAIHLAMKSVGGELSYRIYAADGAVPESTTLSTATDLYRDISGLNDRTVVIVNESTSKAILSITNLKITYASDPSTQNRSGTFFVSRSGVTLALASLMPASEQEQPPTEPALPETTVPQETVPEASTPGETVPETTAPQETVPETTGQEADVPETFQPEATQPSPSNPGISESPESEPTLPQTQQPFVNPFRDISEDAFYYEAVLWAAEAGITTGKTQTTFQPDAICLRSQVVTFLWRAMGSPEPTGKVNPFTDVSEDAYYYKAVLWAYENGITTGKTATTFAPTASCTRAQVVTFLWRAMGKPSGKGLLPFGDISGSAYYAHAVLWAAEAGITTGKTQTTFRPEGLCTRGQIVTFLYRLLAQEKKGV